MARAPFNCPSCDRPTLQSAENLLTAFQCAVCGEIVRESGASA